MSDFSEKIVQRIKHEEEQRKLNGLTDTDVEDLLETAGRQHRGCPSLEDLADYVGNESRWIGKIKIGLHLWHCAKCRLIVKGARSAIVGSQNAGTPLDRRPAPQLRPSYLGFAAGLAAMLVLISLIIPGSRPVSGPNEPNGDPSLRSRGTGSTNEPLPSTGHPATGALSLGLAPRGAVGRAGQSVAMVVGINQYPPVTKLQSLQGAVNDAQCMAKILRQAGYLVIEMVPGGPQGYEPTRGNVLQMLKRLPNTAKDGNFLLYWSGHGVGDGGEAYLMPSDATDDAKNTGLTLSLITDTLRSTELNLRSLVLIADVCKVGANNSATAFADNLHKLHREGGDWLIITSTSQGRQAYEKLESMATGLDVGEAREPHGLFTFHLLTARYRTAQRQGLLVAEADQDSDGRLTWDEAFEYARAKTERFWVSSQRHSDGSRLYQSPQKISSRTRFETNIFCATELIGKSGQVSAINPKQILPPPLDAQGRFVVYQDIADDTLLPFLPSGWMWGINRKTGDVSPAVVAQMMRLDVASTDQPLAGKGTCVRWQIVWSGQAGSEKWNAGWAALGWFSGPDSPPWWAQPGDNRGHYFNLETPRRFQALKFAARSPVKGTKLMVKVGILSRDRDQKPLALGDSLAWPVSAPRWFELSQEWTEFRVELKPFQEAHDCNQYRENGLCLKCGDSLAVPKRNNLERICSLGFVVERSGPNGQSDPDVPVVIYLDQICFQ